MRLSEFASAEEQLGLLRIIIDNTWTAVKQQADAQARASTSKNLQKPKAAPRKSATSKPVPISIPKPPSPITHINTKASANKQLPVHHQKSPTKSIKLQGHQQQLAKEPHKDNAISNPQQRIYPQPPTPIPTHQTPIEPLNNSYDERDMDELVLHSRAQHPFNTISQTKNGFSGQKHGF